jgi:aspartyl-tRNA(Asn)/glutamyl-tRNA(Gln) amidotransferase subunit C
MSLTPQDIDRIANLARLELKPEESERMLTQINGFFGIVEAMQAVDTTGIEPMAHPVAAIQDITLRLRPDVASEMTGVSGIILCLLKGSECLVKHPF